MRSDQQTTRASRRPTGCLLRAVRARVARDDAGFTLIEALVALTIFAMVAAAGTIAVLTGMRSETDTSDRVAATQIARQEVERARALPRSALPSLSPAASVARGGKTYSVSRSLSYAPATATACPSPSATPSGTDVRKVQLTIRVTVPGSGRSVRMDSVLAC